jgi:hypothetical protein
MDLISWKLHRPADEQHEDWRFRCLVRHVSDLMRVWVRGRELVRKETEASARRERADEVVGAAVRLLCHSVLREDPDVLRRPAGGAAAGYSIASGSDRWRLLEEQTEDRPIQPLGLTGTEEAEAFRRSIDARLANRHRRARYWQPPRALDDLCKGLGPRDPLPAGLQCTPEEIEWATSASDQVETLWIPPRAQFLDPGDPPAGATTPGNPRR